MVNRQLLNYWKNNMDIHPFQVIQHGRHATRKKKDIYSFISQKELDAIRPDLVAYTKFSGAEYDATRQQIEKHDIYIIDPAGVDELAAHIRRENMTDTQERHRRMEADRGLEKAKERIMHDIGKFAGFDNYDMALNNRTTNDLDGYYWMTQQIEHLREVIQFGINRSDDVAAGTTEYGIEATLPKAKGENSDPVFRAACNNL
ncbi:hypothetical protein ACBP89_25830 [Aneurinibacillus aneurinilyticus]